MNKINNNQKLFLGEIGEVILKPSKRAVHVRITINRIGQVCVTLPDSVKKEDALDFVFSKKNWIQQSKKKIEEKKVLKLKANDLELKKFWQRTQIITKELSQKNNLSYNKLVFKTLKSRWGSCSVDNIICLNNMLYYLPRHLVEYVILHELVHTKIKNHSQDFWKNLEEICKNAKLYRKELRDGYRIG